MAKAEKPQAAPGGDKPDAAAAAASGGAPPPAPTLAEPPKVDEQTKAVAAEVPAPRKVSPIVVSRWSEAAFKQARHAITPEAGIQPEDLLKPEYFANIASKVSAGDIIEVRPADNGFYVELYVWERGDNWLQVSVLQGARRPDATPVPSTDAGFLVEFVEGPKRHRVLRKSDKAEVAVGFATIAAANAWLEHNKGKLAA